MSDKAIITIYGAIAPHKIPALYAGVADLADAGVCSVVVSLPYGVRPFPRVPAMVFVPCDTTFVDFPPEGKPVMTVNFWEDVHQY